MEGRTHIATTAAVWTAVAPLAATMTGQHLTPVTWLASTLVAAGWGLGPDIDHPEATIAATHGPLSRPVTRIVSRLTGGHRGATHTVRAALVVAGAAWAAATWWPAPAVAVSLALPGAWALTAMSFAAHGEMGRLAGHWARRLLDARIVPPAAALLLGLAAASAGLPAWWVAPTALVGWIAHLAGDQTTNHLFRYGGRIEHALAVFAACFTVVAVGHGIWGR